MPSMKKNSVFVFFCFVMISCGSKTFNTSDEMVKYINDEQNGYKYSKIINNVKYELLYRPTDLLVQQELNDNYNSKQVRKVRDKYQKYMYFNLSISLNDKELLTNVASDKARFGEIVNELAFGMEGKINLFTQEKDTLKMSDFIYPRMYGMTNNTTLMVVYPRDKEALRGEALNFIIQDLGFYTGEVKFKINSRKIQNEPKLSFKI